MQRTRTVLIADEDPAARRFLADNLTADGFRTVEAHDRASALAKLAVHEPDLVICDINGDTLDLLDAVRNADPVGSKIAVDTPLIVLSVRAEELARVRYLARGGDDVVLKPFGYAELLARIRAVLRRCEAAAEPSVIRVSAVRINCATREVRVGERLLKLTVKEYELLRQLAREPTRVHGKQDLLRDVWGFQANGTTRTVDCFASRLRKKLRAAGETELIDNVWGVGYRLHAPSPGAHAA